MDLSPTCVLFIMIERNTLIAYLDTYINLKFMPLSI